MGNNFSCCDKKDVGKKKRARKRGQRDLASGVKLDSSSSDTDEEHAHRKFAVEEEGTTSSDEDHKAFLETLMTYFRPIVAGVSTGAAVSFNILHLKAGLGWVLTSVNVGQVLLVCWRVRAKPVGPVATLALVGGGSGTGFWALTHYVSTSIAVQATIVVVGCISPVVMINDILIVPLARLMYNELQGHRMPTMKEQRRMAKTIARVVWADKWWWITIYITGSLSVILTNLFPLAISTTTMAIVEGKSVLNNILILTGFILLEYALTTTLKLLVQEGEMRTNLRVSKMMMFNVTNQDMEFFDNMPLGYITNQLGQAKQIVDVVSLLIPTAISSVFGISTAFIVLSRYNLTLGIVCIAGVPFDLLVSYFFSIYAQGLASKMQQLKSKLATTVLELVQSVRTVKLLAAEIPMQQGFWDVSEEMITIRRKTRPVMASKAIIMTVVPYCINIAIFVYASSLVLANKMDPGALLVVSMYQSSLQSEFRGIPNVISGWARIIGNCKMVFAFLHRDPNLIRRGNLTADPVEGKIEFRNVSFSYVVRKPPGENETAEQLVEKKKRVAERQEARKLAKKDDRFDDPLDLFDDLVDRPREVVEVLRNFNLSIRPGEVVALVGRSGAGKSTVANLILGLYDPDEGDVLIDDQPLHAYDPQWFYTKALGYVPQMPILFNESIKDNIVGGLKDREIPQEDIEAIAKKAQCHDFIVEQSEGYETKCGFRGSLLSGGQRQRVSIARALIRNPSILVLDEATAALDAESEALVSQAIQEAMTGRTVVIIAHRLSTIRLSNRVLCMANGMVVEEGTHDELVAKGGMYAGLVMRQMMDAVESERSAATPRSSLPSHRSQDTSATPRQEGTPRPEGTPPKPEGTPRSQGTPRPEGTTEPSRTETESLLAGTPREESEPEKIDATGSEEDSSDPTTAPKGEEEAGPKPSQ